MKSADKPTGVIVLQEELESVLEKVIRRNLPGSVETLEFLDSRGAAHS